METDYRLRIRRVVSVKPGLHLRELQRLLGMSFSNTRYHVERLTKNGEIDRVEDGGFSRLYPARTTSEDKLILSILRRSTDTKILSCLLHEHRSSQKRICTITGLAKSTVSERLAFLLERALIRTENDGAYPITYVLADPAKLGALLHRNSGILAKATSNFVDLWDF